MTDRGLLFNVPLVLVDLIVCPLPLFPIIITVEQFTVFLYISIET